jgi:hypothetical protein
MNNEDLLQWICAFLLVILAGAVITFAWVKAIDGLLWVIKRVQGDAHRTPGEHA